MFCWNSGTRIHNAPIASASLTQHLAAWFKTREYCSGELGRGWKPEVLAWAFNLQNNGRLASQSARGHRRRDCLRGSGYSIGHGLWDVRVRRARRELFRERRFGRSSYSSSSCLCIVGRQVNYWSTPRALPAFFLGLFIYELVHSDVPAIKSGGTSLTFAIIFSIILLGGIFEALFGLIKLGSLIKFAPQPVM